MKNEWGEETIRGLVARPMLLTTPFLIAGIWFSFQKFSKLHLISFSVAMFLWMLLVMLAVRRTYTGTLLLMFVGAFGLGCLTANFARYGDIANTILLDQYINQKTKVTGHIIDVPERGSRTTHLPIEANYCKANGHTSSCSGKIIYYIGQNNIKWQPGDLVEINSTLREIKDNGNPGEFRYGEYLKNRGFKLRSYLRSSKSIRLIKKDDISGIRTYFQRLRGKISGWIDSQENIENPQIIKALIIGMKKGIPAKVRESFLKGGTAHLLAISGLHLGVMSFWVFLVFSFLVRRSKMILRYFSINQIAALFTLPITWVYALLAGMHIATFRAAIMISIYMLAYILWRRSDSVNNLFVAAFIILLIYPYSIFEVGFQLSFVSVLAIILAVPRLNTLLPWKVKQLVVYQNSWFKKVFSYLYFVATSSLICFFVTAPIVAHWFHAISYSGVLVNVVIVPLFSMLLVPMLALFAVFWLFNLPFTSDLLNLADSLFSLIYQLQETIVEFIGGLVYLPQYSFVVIFFYYLTLLLGLYFVYPPWNMAGRPKSGLWKEIGNKKAMTTVLSISVMMFCGSLAFSSSQLNSDLEFQATIPHLQSGTCVYIDISGGRNELICSGINITESRDPVKRTVAPMLWKSGKTEISTLYLTSKKDAAQKVKTELERMFEVESVKFIYDRCKGKTLKNITKCDTKDKYLIVWKLPHKDRLDRFPAIPVMQYKSEEASIIVLPSPHLIDFNIWQEFSKQLSGENVTVIMFGPGKNESVKNMIEAIKPLSVILAMNRKLSRYLSRDNWLDIKNDFPEIYRTDYDGAFEIDSFGVLVKSAEHL